MLNVKLRSRSNCRRDGTGGAGTPHETLHAGIDIHTSVSVEGLQHLLPIEYLGFIPVYFLLVVIQSPSG